MTPAELRNHSSPESLPLAIRALWFDAAGDWSKAHDACQEAKSRDGDWVHAYLHRKEGDLSNAGYWYSRAGRVAPAQTITLDAEWLALAEALLKK